jgi:hypothetical protein
MICGTISTRRSRIPRKKSEDVETLMKREGVEIIYAKANSQTP